MVVVEQLLLIWLLLMVCMVDSYSVHATLESAEFCSKLTAFRATVERAVVAAIRAADRSPFVATQWESFDAALGTAK